MDLSLKQNGPGIKVSGEETALSERSLRPVKSKMKISGQFESEERAGDYAILRTYIETCRRNGINEIEALIRACNNNPYTVKEIFG